MSPMRHDAGPVTDEEPLVRSLAVDHPPGTVVLPQPPGWDQLVYAAAGVMTVATAAGTWVVPPHRAVWVPDGLDHRLRLDGRTSLRTVYLRAGQPGVPREACAVNVPPLLRELIIHLGGAAPLYASVPAHAGYAALLVEQVRSSPAAPLQLPRPADARARAVADAVLTDPADGRSLAELAHDAGASRRTVERAFRAETGLTAGQWRTRARLLHALARMAEGATATAAGAAVGYATPSAFGAAFRRELGTSPRRYLARPR
jgi:AraC-like DNA-binding protein